MTATTLFLLVCLSADPTQCSEIEVGTFEVTVEQCEADAPRVIADAMRAARLSDPELDHFVRAFACVDRGRGV